jgi:predicted phage terminase large subunit-like protein
MAKASRRLNLAARQQVEVRPPSRIPFGLAWLQRYLRHYFSSQPADFHEPLCDRLATLHIHRGSKEAIIAPREGAKSTIVTLGYALFAAVERFEPFTVVLSDSSGQADDKIHDLKRELETNEQLIQDYSEACGAGAVWRGDLLELKNGCRVQAISRKGRIRGRRNRQDRPSLIIFDDVENNSIITSEAERKTSWRWVTREVLPAGSSTTNFISIGSALHRECTAVRLGHLAGWRSYTHRAVHVWPERMDLWDEWERIATNLADDNRAETAMAFYLDNKADMDRGAATYWSRWPIYDLMQRRAEMGAAAFDTEYQGIPSTEGVTEWPAEWFDRQDVWFTDWPDDLVLRAQSLDPSKGSGTDTSDDQAHVHGGLGKDGIIYVEAKLVQETVDKMIRRSLDTAAAFAPLDALAIEDNDGMGMVVAEFEEQIRLSRRVIPLRAVRQTVNKEVRIRRLGIYFARGRIRFRTTIGTRKLVNQLKDFPQGDHDDGPDALELLVRMLEELTRPRR